MCAVRTTRSRARALLTLGPSSPPGVPEQNFRGVLVGVVVAATAVPALVLMCLCKR